MNYLFEFATKQTLSFTLIIAMLLMSVLFLLVKFKVKWDGFKPIFENRSDDRVAEFEEKLRFAQIPDFIKKTDNSEYIGYYVAKKPYVAVWSDGNWNSEEHFQHFDKLSRLWENEDCIVIYGKNPNLPSDLNHVIEEKAKSFLERKINLTIYCNFSIADYLKKYYKDYTNVEIIGRN